MRDLIDRLRRRLSDADLREEVDSHLAHEIDDQLDRGLSPEQARYVALRKFGNVTRHLERFRETSPAFCWNHCGRISDMRGGP